MTEREYFEIHATYEEIFRLVLQTGSSLHEPSVTVDMVAYCFVEGKIKLY